MVQVDHLFWFNARQMVVKIGAMTVSKQAHVRTWADSAGDAGESPSLPTDTSGKPVGLRGIGNQDGMRLLKAIKQRFQQLAHRLQAVVIEQRP